ncbi:MAG: hypothetical protein D6788_01000 [Planctomycetota bacterium]|nr:MAG: hypothetical protein D6788_01000 [Planctomycetota bacterium]
MENDGWLPTVVEAGARFGAMRRPTPWFLQLYRASLLPDPLVLVCPKDPYRYRMVPAGSRFEEKVRADYSSYGLSSFIMTAGNGALADLDRKRPTRPADTILAADIGPDRSTFRTQMAGAAGPLRNYSLLTWDDGFDPFSGRPVEPWLTTRHGDGIHVLTIGGGVRKARTKPLMREPVRRYYDHCAAGGCTFCNELRAFHYSFARDRLYWWTGPAPSTK